MSDSFLKQIKTINLALLPKVVQSHYDVIPGQAKTILVEGVTARIEYQWWVGIMIRLAKLVAIDLPTRGTHLRTTLKLIAKSGDSSLTYWERIFHYPDGSVINLRSRFSAYSEGVVEYFKLGMSLKMSIEQTQTGIVYHGISTKLGVIPIPNFLSLGKLTVTENAISDSEYYLSFEYRHPLLGRTYFFEGLYRLSKQ